MIHRLSLEMHSALSIGQSDYSNLDMFLADYDGNGIVDVTDANLILAAVN
ncbi:MAG: hypothetical protein J6B75_05075 [Ruminococcus sp.]|nr:hypothetical protein [Ruminococcus sp.]